MKFAFIDAEKGLFPLAVLCRLLSVSRQGYYQYVQAKAEPSARVRNDLELCEHVRRIHAESRGTYGSPRVWMALQKEGIHVSKRRVERTMRGLGLSARKPRRARTTTVSDPTHKVETNKLARDFTASAPNERWVTDITYVWTDEGWCYLAVILDLYSRAVVGWSLSSSLATGLVLNALSMAVHQRRPKAGLLHHSDRGCQYTSRDYRDELAKHGIVVSMSRKGNCWDNAVAESFFSTIKGELIERQRWSSQQQLREAVFEYIHVFYNRKRLHTSLGFKTPSEVEEAFHLTHAA